MVAGLLALAVGLAAAGLALTAFLLARQTQLTRRARLQVELERRLRPVAIAIVEEQSAPLDRVRSMRRREQRALSGLVGRYSRWVQGDARLWIADFFEQTGLVAEEVRALRSRRAWRRVAAASALGDMVARRALPDLLKALDDEDRDVRAAAVRSLGGLESGESTAPIVRALVGEQVPQVTAAGALLELGERAAPALRALAAEREAELRATAIQLLGYVGASSDAPMIATHLRDPSAEVRAKACNSLAKIGTPDQHDALREALGDRIWFVRVQAAHGLGAVGSAEDVPLLLAMARSDEFDVGRAAAGAAARLDPGAVRAARDSGGSHVEEAVDALALAAR